MNARAVDFDLHNHTLYSDGRSSIDELANGAKACGLKGFAVTDHIYSPEAFIWYLKAAKEIETAALSYQVPMILGVEATILNRKGELSISCGIRERLGLALAEISLSMDHGIFNRKMSKKEAIAAVCEALVNACANPCFDIVAHPFNLGRFLPWHIDLKDLDDESMSEVAAAFKANGKAFEINNQIYWWHPMMPYSSFEAEYLRIVGIFKSHGVKFSAGSDSHSCCGIGNLRWTEAIFEKAGLQDCLYIPPQFADVCRTE